MTARAAITCAGLLGLVLLGGCSFDPNNGARGCDGCTGTCYLGYCLTGIAGNPGTGGSGGSGAPGGQAGNTAVAGGTGAAGEMAGTGSTTPEGPCKMGDACYAGAPASLGTGVCREGISECQGDTFVNCIGQVLPTAEACNQLDDDCDGKTDEDASSGSCQSPGVGACAQGELRCELGVEACRSKEPTRETCNGEDDDCDGETDNDSDVPCYPDGMAGCTRTPEGGFDCMGSCAAGMQTCGSGVLSECLGVVIPMPKEVCGATGADAGDENCNGTVDDGCPCTAGQSQSCYGGPNRTAGVGKCKAGTQTCSGGVFGACQGSVTPEPETCMNQGADNDCNRLRDDVPGLTFLCVDTNKLGLCRFGLTACNSGGQLVCVTGEPTPTETACDGFDEDCDGSWDENFNLATDERNCGACGTACSAGQMCCGGQCMNPSDNNQHCGSCGNSCGQARACCGGECQPTNTVAHCGSCSPCGSGQACCGGACIAANTDDHCGPGCGVACGANQDCCNGACVDTNSDAHCGPGCGAVCGANQDCCNGTCVNTNTDAHCGPGCGAVCGANQDCCNGSCVDTNTDAHCGPGCGTVCNGNQDCCNGSCVDTNTDAHCGSGCGSVCNGNQDCCNGACVATNTDAHCGPGCGTVCNDNQDCCGGDCVATNTADHCGSCNGCTTPGQQCCNGQCALPSDPVCGGNGCPGGCGLNQTCCGGACVDTSSTNAHCGGCNMPCNIGSCLSCVNSKCVDSAGNECL